ncbi:Pkinase-domain-containing protein [Rhizodiscina lignyota]|uniref:Serine/threonine-protein kinase BUR1 n=1 Tax=Rhizodiscina lignyota TaxID=1504668 RepID=A0A9P4I979_9PEZI|nr:Pkinase-domain-containing protein [Rhizodiscina lignyota]
MAQAASSTPPVPLNRQFKGCSGIGGYHIIEKLGEGTFGEVHKAKSLKTAKIFALKKILMHNEKEGFPITALREIKLLKMLSHVNILQLEEMAIERSHTKERKRAILYMVTPYMEHDLSGLLDNPDVTFTEPQIKCYMLQLLQGLKYLHNSHILHRDMKAANLLISNRGILQIADFGLARHYDEPVPQRGKGGGEGMREYTTLVVTRWYRPPELLLHLRRYTTAIDMWGAGCVFGEMFKRKPILTGNSDLNQALIIFELVGSPTDESMPGWRELSGYEEVKAWKPSVGNLEQVFREQGSSAISLLRSLLTLDWRKRINAIDALEHPYFQMDPKPARPEDIPLFPDSHELDRRNARGQNAALPPAPAGGTVGMGPNSDWTGSGPPTGPPWANGDRGDRHYRPGGHGQSGWSQDRGPPGLNGPPRGGQGYPGRAPHSGYDQRGPPPHRRDGPGWQHNDSHIRFRDHHIADTAAAAAEEEAEAEEEEEEEEEEEAAAVAILGWTRTSLVTPRAEGGPEIETSTSHNAIATTETIATVEGGQRTEIVMHLHTVREAEVRVWSDCLQTGCETEIGTYTVAKPNSSVTTYFFV